MSDHYIVAAGENADVADAWSEHGVVGNRFLSAALVRWALIKVTSWHATW